MNTVEHNLWLASKGLMTVDFAAVFLATTRNEALRLIEGGHLTESWFSEEPRVSRAEVEQFAAVTFSNGKSAISRRALLPVEPFEPEGSAEEANQAS